MIHYAFLDSAVSVRQALFNIFTSLYSHGTVECTQAKLETCRQVCLPVLRSTLVFTRVISLSDIYYKYASLYLILLFIFMYEICSDRVDLHVRFL